MSNYQTFVGRSKEMKILRQKLKVLLEQHSLQIVFIAGQAGEGKTTLAEYFADTALMQRTENKIVVAIGRCNQQTSVDEAYLPFREILAQLTGAKPTLLNLTLDPEATIWSKSVITGIVSALKEYGPDLIGSFVPGTAMPARALVTALDKGYQSYAQGEADRPGLDFTKVAKQFTDTLRHAVGVPRNKNKGRQDDTTFHPLMLILDDFQWADALSIRLFKHLCDALADVPIFFIVTYRSDEIDADRDGKPHPLKEVTLQLKQDRDASTIRLDSTNDSQAAGFVSELLKVMNVKADPAFVKDLLDRTNGQPLLTVETVRYLQYSGHLVEESGRWNPTEGFEWDKIPARLEKLENLIETRLNRLSPDLRDVLDLASVEGQDFTAQVIMDVLGKDEPTVLRYLSGELAHDHQLVSEIEERRIGLNVLSTYRFVNATFHKTVYEALNPGERRLAHGKIARSLEKLYGDARIPDIAVRLEHHYGLALEPKAQAKYLIRIAQQLHSRAQYDEAREKYLEAAELASIHRDTAALIEARMYYSSHFTGARDNNRELAWKELSSLLEDARRIGAERCEAFILRQLGIIQGAQGQVAGAVKKHLASLQIAEKLEDPKLQGEVITSLANLAKKEKAYDEAEDLLRKRLRMALDNGESQAQLVTLMNLADLYAKKGGTAEAQAFCDEASGLATELRARDRLLGVQLTEAEIAYKERRYALAAQYLKHVIEEARRLGQRGRVRSALQVYCEMLVDRGATTDAIPLVVRLYHDEKASAVDKERLAGLLLDCLLPTLRKQYDIGDGRADIESLASDTVVLLDKQLLDLVEASIKSQDVETMANAREELGMIFDEEKISQSPWLIALRRIVDGERDASAVSGDLEAVEAQALAELLHVVS